MLKFCCNQAAESFQEEARKLSSAREASTLQCYYSVEVYARPQSIQSDAEGARIEGADHQDLTILQEEILDETSSICYSAENTQKILGIAESENNVEGLTS